MNTAVGVGGNEAVTLVNVDDIKPSIGNGTVKLANVEDMKSSIGYGVVNDTVRVDQTENLSPLTTFVEDMPERGAQEFGSLYGGGVSVANSWAKNTHTALNGDTSVLTSLVPDSGEITPDAVRALPTSKERAAFLSNEELGGVAFVAEQSKQWSGDNTQAMFALGAQYHLDAKGMLQVIEAQPQENRGMFGEIALDKVKAGLPVMLAMDRLQALDSVQQTYQPKEAMVMLFLMTRQDVYERETARGKENFGPDSVLWDRAEARGDSPKAYQVYFGAQTDFPSSQPWDGPRKVHAEKMMEHTAFVGNSFDPLAPANQVRLNDDGRMVTTADVKGIKPIKDATRSLRNIHEME